MFRQLHNQRAWNERKQCPGERNAFESGSLGLDFAYFFSEKPTQDHCTSWLPFARICVWTSFSQAYSSEVTFIPLFLLCIKYAAAAKLLQSCPTLCDPRDGSPPGSPIPGILQARTLEWIAISFSNAWKWKVKVKSLSPVRLLATPWTEAYQAPPSMGVFRQEYWSGVPLPSLVNEWVDKNVNLVYCLRAIRGMLEWTWHLFLMHQIYTMGSHLKHSTLK